MSILNLNGIFRKKNWTPVCKVNGVIIEKFTEPIEKTEDKHKDSKNNNLKHTNNEAIPYKQLNQNALIDPACNLTYDSLAKIKILGNRKYNLLRKA